VNGLFAMIEAMSDPEIVGRLDALRLDAPLAAVDQFGPKEFVVRVELKQQLTRWSLRLWLGRRESYAHREILADPIAARLLPWRAHALDDVCHRIPTDRDPTRRGGLGDAPSRGCSAHND
jgi:hypothetical protein